MKSKTPHDPLDDLIAAALHGDLTPEERAQFETRLQTDPNAQAAYQEAQAMHDLLEKTNRSAQPDPDFEQRMVSGVRRKLANPPHVETAWESLLVLWNAFRATGRAIRRVPMLRPIEILTVLFIIVIVAGVALGPITSGIKKAKESGEVQTGHAMELAEYQAQIDAGAANPAVKSVQALPDGRIVEISDADQSQVDITDKVREFAKTGVLPVEQNTTTVSGGNVQMAGKQELANLREQPVKSLLPDANAASVPATADLQASLDSAKADGAFAASGNAQKDLDQEKQLAGSSQLSTPADAPVSVTMTPSQVMAAPAAAPPPASSPGLAPATDNSVAAAKDSSAMLQSEMAEADKKLAREEDLPKGKFIRVRSEIATDQLKADEGAAAASAPGAATGNAPAATITGTLKPAPPAVDTRKLIRNGQLDLEVKSYQNAFDEVTALTRAAGGYVDTSTSQRGGNGKLQGTVVVKVLPENLDAFLLKLHDLGEVENESVSTADVTKDYFDTQARIVNSQKMEEQLQELLKRENGKVSDLLAVEHELARVRGDIEQMQGQLKLYDFQIAFATVTMNIAEKDLNQTAAYVLKEQDNFSLFAIDVEGAYEKARAAADKYNGQVLAANLDHQGNGANQVGASLVVMVAPDQIESFLTDIRGLGRVANFTRETERVAKDGGDSSQPADQTKTEKDKVRVQLAIRSDNDSRKQVALVVVTKGVDQALEDAKAAALANAGTEILSSGLNTTPEGSSTAQISVRVPGKEYTTLMDAYRALGRQASVRVQRNDNNGPGANGDDVPVIVTLALTDNDTPVQETDLSISAADVDAQAQLIKKQAADSGVEIKASTFQRQPDGSELAQMTLRLPLAKYPAFLETLKKAGEVNSLSVARDDRPDQTRSDDGAPAEIRLQLRTHYQIVTENTGVWGTLRNNFGSGVTTLLGCITVIGVVLAFLIPWVIALGLLAWIGRRIYIWRRK